MNYYNEPYRVFITVNEEGLVTAINSSAFLENSEEWIEIDSGNGDKYHHAQGNYFDKPIMTMGGVYRYKLVDGVPVECSDEELVEQKEKNRTMEEPTWQDKIEAQVTYNSMMLGTLIEEV